MIDQQTAAQKMVIEAQGIASKRSIEGYTYQDERGFDVAEKVAGNQAVGQFTNIGVGMGMISGIGGTVGNTVGSMMSDALTAQKNAESSPVCAKCGTPLNHNAKFCLECGAKVTPPLAENEMLCPSCGAKVAKGKFCLECGASLSPQCPNCKKEVPAGAKFCLECGTKLN